jgi:intracellular septation protein
VYDTVFLQCLRAVRAQTMKLLFDFFPILVFFVAYKLYGIFVATAVLMGAAVVQVGWSWLRHRRVDKLYWVTLGLTLVLGGFTLVLKDDTFIKWKPTVVNWLFALAFFISQYVGSKPILQRMMSNNIDLPDPIWTRLNWSWIIFFTAIGAVNLYVAFSGHFSENDWVNFKLFGMMGLTIAFVIGQAFYLSRHIKTDQDHDTGPGH